MKMRCIALILFAALAVFDSGCRSHSGNEPHSQIKLKGSDTMIPLARKWAEGFMTEHPGVDIQVSGGGSGIGINALIGGNTDICMASRRMKPTEKSQVSKRMGVDVSEIPVALDGLAVYVNNSNPIQSLTLFQLKAIYTGIVDNWHRVGGMDAKIVVYGRDINSGTHSFFREHALNNEEYARSIRIMPGTSAIVNEISRDAFSIGYGGIAYASGVRIVPIRRDENSPAVLPTLDAVKSGQYALSRNLLFYIAGNPSANLKPFIDWVLGPKGQELCTAVGYYPMAQK
jgi:phosphate transport system substrate-binding protein